MARRKSRTKRVQKRTRTGRMKRSRVSRRSRVSKRSKVSRNNKRTQRRGTPSRRRLRKTRNNRIRVEGGAIQLADDNPEIWEESLADAELEKGMVLWMKGECECETRVISAGEQDERGIHVHAPHTRSGFVPKIVSSSKLRAYKE